MTKKLQVFISSTYTDLKKERQKSVEAILSAGHIPAGMELFHASGQSQKEIIKDWLADSDIYMLILGGRYGSIDDETGKSYTEWEYELAGKIGIPRFALVLTDEYIDERLENKTLDGRALEMNDDKYLKFKNNLQNDKLIAPLSSLDSIKGEVHGSLARIQKNHPDLVGWIKGNNLIEMAKEIEETPEELEHYKKEDSKTLRIIKKTLYESGIIDFMKNHSFGSPFFINTLDLISEYQHESKNNPEFEFLDSELEDLKLELDRHISKIYTILAVNTFDVGVNPNLVGVPKEWQREQPERHEKVIDELHKESFKIVGNYNDLIRLARRKGISL